LALQIRTFIKTLVIISRKLPGYGISLVKLSTNPALKKDSGQAGMTGG